MIIRNDGVVAAVAADKSKGQSVDFFCLELLLKEGLYCNKYVLHVMFILIFRL